MPFQMIDREKWFAGPDGQTFRRRISDKQRTGESRSARGGEGVDLIDRNLRGCHCALEQARQLRDMIAGRNFRHYAAEFFMVRNLRGHFAGEQLRAALAVSAAQDRHRGLVTRGFDRENCHKAVVIPSVVK